MSSRPPVSASRSFDQTVQKEATDLVWKSFGTFSERFQETCSQLDDRNREHITLMSDDLTPVLSDEMREETDLVELLQTCGNMELNKLLLVFADLMQEMDQLSGTSVSDLLTAIALYDGKDLSNFLPIMNDAICFNSRCCDVAANVMQQLCALNGKNCQSVDVTGIRFDCVLQSLANLSVAALNLECAIIGNEILKQDMNRYKRFLQSQLQQSLPDDEKKRTQLKVLTQMVSMMVDSCEPLLFSQYMDALVGSARKQKFISICDLISSFVRNSIQEYESSAVRDDRQWTSINCMFLHYIWISRKEDPKLLTRLLEVQRKTCTLLCHLPANVTIIPDHFLSTHLPKGVMDQRMLQSLDQQRMQLLKSTSLAKEWKGMKQKIITWMTAFGKNFVRKNDLTISIAERLASQMRVLQEAYEFANNITFLTKDMIFLHLHHATAISRKDLIVICQFVSLLCSIQMSLGRRKATVLLFQSSYAQYHSFLALKALNGMKKRLVSEVKKYSEKKLDIISAVILTCNCLAGAVLTSNRQTLISLCSAIVTQCMTDSEMIAVLPALDKLHSCSRLLKKVAEQTVADFIFFNRTTLLPVYFTHVSDVAELRYVLRSLHVGPYSAAAQDDEVYSLLKSQYMDVVCRDVETELRIQTHSHLLQAQADASRCDLTDALSQPAMRVTDKRMVSMSDHVASHLNETSYNLTCIALHDWKTYEWMLVTARSRLGLRSFTQSQLPTQTLEQGLDVLQITRSINSFVTNYSYNLNNQIFVEKASENKHLNVLFIRHVANSIQTHGYGIVNTAVNMTYQFLRHHLNHVSQFLFEEHVQSRLVKDIRLFRQQSSQQQQFPYERAERFVSGIRKLGVTSDGQSFLDKFRVTVTEIGNALGFVRMLRSGALHCSSSSVHFVPDVDELSDIKFHELCDKFEGVGGEVLTAADNLDHILLTLSRNFSQATDYFKLLVHVFGDKIREQAHLKNFFVVLPALTMSQAEFSITSKQKMDRKKSVAAAFTDDGFAVGVAYLLRLLDQVSDFQSLQWFPSVRQKLMNERTALSADQQHTSSLTLKRLTLLQNEFDLLEYSITSCNVLFRS